MNPRELTQHEMTLEIPQKKVSALLRMFDTVLLTEGDEAQRILNQIRGRRGRRHPLTFGELRGMVANPLKPLQADGSRIASQAKAAGVEDLGEAPRDLANMLILVTPDLSVCDECGSYPVSTLGGFISMLEKGRCPRKGCTGLITAVEQGQEYDRWTAETVSMTPWAQTHDRTSDSARHWPIRYDEVLKAANLDSGLRSAMEREGLVVQSGPFQGQPDVVKFLIFSHRGGRQCGNGSLADVFAALSEPQLIAGRGYDQATLRVICREAKAFVSPTVDPWNVGSSGSSRGDDRKEKPKVSIRVLRSMSRSQLRKTLLSIVSLSDMSLLIADAGLPYERIDVSGSLETYLYNTLEVAARSGLVGDFLDMVIERYPHKFTH